MKIYIDTTYFDHFSIQKTSGLTTREEKTLYVCNKCLLLIWSSNTAANSIVMDCLS